jgi:hypothetical protein
MPDCNQLSSKLLGLVGRKSKENFPVDGNAGSQERRVGSIILLAELRIERSGRLFCFSRLKQLSLEEFRGESRRLLKQNGLKGESSP